MLQFVTFAIIYGIMMFIWSFVYLNKSNDKINQAFLTFHSVLLLWMVLSISNIFNDGSRLGIVIKTIYFYCMLNMSLFFLFFVYRLVRRKLDGLFYFTVALNVLTLFSRYLFPIDYTDPTFWRLTDPVIAPIMASIFSFPVVVALYLIFQQYRTTKEHGLKVQLRFIFAGIGIACSVSVISEYMLPTWFDIRTNLSLMYFAFLIFILAIFISIMKHRFLNVRAEYIHRKLFMNAYDGIIIVNKNMKIISINNMARVILRDEKMDSGDKITDYIAGYSFEENYKQHEVTIKAGDQEVYLSVTQYPIDAAELDSAKLMRITDITSSKLDLIREKDLLMEKSNLDRMTGLYSKQYFYEHYYSDREEPSELRRTLLFIDVDDFKSVNDRYGHIAGDRIISALGECIKSNLDCDAKAIRFGGDEFVIILENTPLEEAYRIAEQIRTSACSLNFLPYGVDAALSLSIGLMEGFAPVKDLIVKADMAMYSSKCSGKNRTTVF